LLAVGSHLADPARRFSGIIDTHWSSVKPEYLEDKPGRLPSPSYSSSRAGP